MRVWHTVLSQLPLTIVSAAGHATDETLCECPPSSCLDASTMGAAGTAAPAEPFFFLAPASCLAAADSSAARSATAVPAPAALLSGICRHDLVVNHRLRNTAHFQVISKHESTPTAGAWQCVDRTSCWAHLSARCAGCCPSWRWQTVFLLGSQLCLSPRQCAPCTCHITASHQKCPPDTHLKALCSTAADPADSYKHKGADKGNTRCIKMQVNGSLLC